MYALYFVQNKTKEKENKGKKKQQHLPSALRAVIPTPTWLANTPKYSRGIPGIDIVRVNSIGYRTIILCDSGDCFHIVAVPMPAALGGTHRGTLESLAGYPREPRHAHTLTRSTVADAYCNT